MVPSDYITVNIDKITVGICFTEITFNKLSVITVGNKANILTVTLACIQEMLFLCNFADFRFRIFTQRKLNMCKLILSKRIKNITLVFSIVTTLFEIKPAVFFLNNCIVTCYNIIEAELVHTLKKLFKLQISVTINTRIRSSAVFISSDKLIYNFFLKFVFKIKNVIRHRKTACNSSCIFNIVKRATGLFPTDTDFLVIIKFHCCADTFISFFFH